jgi:uncharacterized protein YndB with AHSA1/START domain
MVAALPLNRRPGGIMATKTRAAAGRATVTPQGEREIHIEREFNAPRDKVWQAYTDAKLVARWWGRGNPLVVERFDLKPGGRWRFIERAPGEKPMGFQGSFREVTPQSRLVQTFGWDGMPGHESVDTMTLTDAGEGRTRVSVDSVFHDRSERDGILEMGMVEGLNQSYDALDQVLESL